MRNYPYDVYRNFFKPIGVKPRFVAYYIIVVIVARCLNGRHVRHPISFERQRFAIT